jgi:predicted nucleic-acid-binding protein
VVKTVSLPDTNVILRYLLKDNADQYETAEKFFESVRTGREKAVILESVLVECVYVLTKYYQTPKAKAVEALAGLLQYKGIVNSDREALLEGLQLFEGNNLDLVDCMLLAKSRSETMRLFSFDKALNKLSGSQGLKPKN